MNASSFVPRFTTSLAPIIPFEPEPSPFGQAPFGTVDEQEDNVIVGFFASQGEPGSDSRLRLAA